MARNMVFNPGLKNKRTNKTKGKTKPKNNRNFSIEKEKLSDNN